MSSYDGIYNDYMTVLYNAMILMAGLAIFYIYCGYCIFLLNETWPNKLSTLLEWAYLLFCFAGFITISMIGWI